MIHWSIPTVQHPLPSEWDPRWKLPRHHHVPETKKGHEFTDALPMFAHGKCPKGGLVWMTPWLWDAKLIYFQVFNPKIPLPSTCRLPWKNHGKHTSCQYHTSHRGKHPDPASTSHRGRPHRKSPHASCGTPPAWEVDFWVKTGLSWTLQNQEFMVPFRSMWYLYYL